MNTRGVIAVVCALALAVSFSSPPAAGFDSDDEGSVCEILADATPGLYGLCVAFCEAQQCVPDYALADPLANCPPGSKRVLEKYNERRRPDDPEMPCLSEGGCPCWTLAELATLAPTEGAERFQCMSTYDFDAQLHQPERFRIQFGVGWADGSWVGITAFFDPDEYSQCQIQTYDSQSGDFTHFDLTTTEAQHRACRTMIAQYANERSVPCYQ